MTGPRSGARSRRAPITETLTDHQRADARTWMQAARVWTIERYPYLDTALTSMLLVESPGLGTVAVDARWRLYYDPVRTLTVQAEHGIEVLATDWIHEVMHLLRDHCVRWTDLGEPASQQPIYNVAADAHVNADVADLGLPLLPTDVTFGWLPASAGCQRAMTTEEIYRRILGQVEVSPHDCGSGSGGGQRSWEQPIGDDQADGSVDAADAEIIREDTATKVRGESAHSDVPAGLRVWADHLLEPTIDWRTELRSVVSRRLGHLAGVTDYTFGRPSRRRVPGFSLPGMAGPEPPRVAAIVDTSGSMSANDLRECLGDLIGLLRTHGPGGPGLTVLAVDSRVCDEIMVRQPAEIPRLELHGGGGTDLGIGLDVLAEQRRPPEVVVVLTDGYTPWPPAPPPGLAAALVIAVISEQDAVDAVPTWMRAIPRA